MLSVLFGRPGGRPLAGNGQNMTVGRSTERSTGRSFLAVSTANGYIFLGAINTPLERVFLKEFLVRIFLYSLVFSQQSKEVFELMIRKDMGIEIGKEFIK